MHIATIVGRLVLLTDSGAVDVHEASKGRFGPDPMAAFLQWSEFAQWAASAELPIGRLYDEADLGPPVPAPSQVFAIGLNYRDHAAESGFAIPTEPAVFTKFRSSITGPVSELALPTATVDWEAEVVAVIGREAQHVDADDAWRHVAGLTIGQDYSERTRQLVPPAPQFSLAKSFPGFAPIGPAVVTVDEFANPDDVGIECTINGEQVQSGRTGDLIFSIPELIRRLSAVVTLYPGDLIFTGTPAGVGNGRTPARFLQPGDEVATSIEGIGELRQTCTSGRPHTTTAR